MSDIERLRQRVAEAERRFGLIDDERSDIGARLLEMTGAVEARVQAQQQELAQIQAEAERQREQAGRHAAEAERLRAEAESRAAELERARAEGTRLGRDNEQLRGLLQSLLQAIEAGGGALSETLRQLDRTMTDLVGGDAPEASIAVGPVGAPRCAAQAAAPEAAPCEPEASEPAAFDPDSPEAAEALAALEVAAGLGAGPAAVPAAGAPDTGEAFELDEPDPGEFFELGGPDPARGGSLEEIMARVSRLVQETEASIAVVDPGSQTIGIIDPAAGPEPETRPETESETETESNPEPEPETRATGTGR